MPYATHLRLTMRGEVRNEGTKVEEFIYGLNLAGGGPLLDEFNQDALNDLAADAVAFHGRPTSYIDPAAVLTEVKLARIGPDGKYTDDPFVVAVSQAGSGQSLHRHPFQVSLAVSLDTEKRGPRGRGRFYMPMPTMPVAADGTVATVLAEEVRDSAKTFIDAVNNSPGFDLTDTRVVVASSFGTNSPVTEVRVGRVLDTIRTRRRQLSEKYSAPAQIA